MTVSGSLVAALALLEGAADRRDGMARGADRRGLAGRTMGRGRTARRRRATRAARISTRGRGFWGCFRAAEVRGDLATPSQSLDATPITESETKPLRPSFASS